MKTLMKDLGNMNPGELEPKPYKGGDVDVVSPIMDSLPEGTSMEFRNAVFEAIVDEVIDDTIAEKESESEAPVTDGDVEEVVEPIVDKAVALYLVSRDEYRKVANMIHSKIVERKTRSSLLAKVAHFVAEAVTETDYNAGADNIDNSIDETVDIGGEIKDATSEKDESPADGTSPTTAKWQKIWASGNRRSRFEADDEYSAGADNIDNSIDETVKIDGEIKDATSEKDESPADGTSPTTAKWENIWKAGKGRPRFEAETEGEGQMQRPMVYQRTKQLLVKLQIPKAKLQMLLPRKMKLLLKELLQPPLNGQISGNLLLHLSMLLKLRLNKVLNLNHRNQVRIVNQVLKVALKATISKLQLITDSMLTKRLTCVIWLNLLSTIVEQQLWYPRP